MAGAPAGHRRRRPSRRRPRRPRPQRGPPRPYLRPSPSPPPPSPPPPPPPRARRGWGWGPGSPRGARRLLLACGARRSRRASAAAPRATG
eukprot:scaffold25433_cov27-Phaeocystis_antarctica.AAC.1